VNSTIHPLTPVLRPRSVAVVGASRDPKKRGYQAVRTLLAMPFEGRVIPVNPNGGELLGLAVAPSVDAIDDTPDLAFVVTPAESVPGILEACARKGIKGAVVSAVGFRESGQEGADLERAIVEICARTGIRLVGPNTSGVLNTAVGLNLVGVKDVPAGSIALLSQSGNVALDIMNDVTRRHTGLSIYVGVGNETDIAFHEYLEYLEQDEGTKAITMYVEGLRDGRKFIEVARRVTHTKPVVLLKGGRSERGVAAARSHTGAIAGSYPVMRAALRQWGVSEVLRSDELLPVGIVLAGQPNVPPGSGIVVLSDGGGHGTLAADALAELGVPLAELNQDTKGKLRALFGRAANVENPVDVAGAGDQNPMIFAEAMEVIAADPDAGGVLLVGLFGGYAIRFAEELADGEAQAANRMVEIMRAARKPLVVHSLYAHRWTEPLLQLSLAGVPIVHSLEIGSRCMRASHARGLFLHERPVPAPKPPPRKIEPPAITTARREHRTVLMETDVRELLEEYDVNVVQAKLCRNADEVRTAFQEIGPPVVIKVVSPAISHKTDAGGVELKIADADAAVDAFQRVLGSAASYAVQRGIAPDIRGVLVLPQLAEPVAELIVGIRQDAQFGPVLSVGAGGVAVEIHHDTSLRGLPIGRAEALQMLEEIKIAKLLKGHRGRPPANNDALADIILGIAACAMAHPEIEELEANPIFAYPDRAVAVDARAFLKDLTVNGGSTR
jgi:acetyltransferase